jgi:predicted TIM-barrel fold metal-dependent hydrolase
MWYDSVGHGHIPALRCAIDSFGADRLVLGTDFPYEAGDSYLRAVSYITAPQVADHETSAILEGNATALLGLTTPANNKK